MQTSNSLALYAWFIATLAGSHSFHLVRALFRSPFLDGAYIIYQRSKKVNNFESFFLHVFLVFRAFHVLLTLFWIISADFIGILRFSCTEHQLKKGNPLEWHGCKPSDQWCSISCRSNEKSAWSMLAISLSAFPLVCFRRSSQCFIHFHQGLTSHSYVQPLGAFPFYPCNS